MSETAARTQTFRFDEMATLVKDMIDNPAEANVDRYVGLEHLDPESLKIRRWGKTTDVEATKLVFRAGDIIFGKRRVYQRKLAVADFDGICSAHAMVLRPKPEVVLSEFLPFFMQSDLFMERALEISVGSLSPTINWKALAQEKFALPPLDEQRRIAEVLRALREANDSLLVATEAFEIVCDAQIQEMFAGAPRIPISDLTEKVTKGTTPTTLGHDYVQRGIPFLRAEDVLDNKVDYSLCEKQIGANTHKEMARSQIFPNDVLLTIAGTVGRVGIAPEYSGGVNCNQAVAIIRLSETSDAKYLFSWLLSRDARAQMFGGQVTGTIANLSLTSIKKLKVPLLLQAEREAVTIRFEALMAARNRMEMRARSIRNIKKTILSESLMELKR